MIAPREDEELKRALEALPQVVSVDAVEVEDHFIKYLSVETRSTGRVTARRLGISDAPRLYEFYSEGLSEKPRRLFAPYPLFHTPPHSEGELASRVADWEKEKDWTAINLFKNDRIIGFGLLKRFKTEQVTSAIVIRDEYLKKKLGYLLQRVIVEQASLLNIERFHVKVVSDNLASMRLHEKCGFRQSRILPPTLYENMFEYLKDCDRKNGYGSMERQLVEMVIELPMRKTPID